MSSSGKLNRAALPAPPVLAVRSMPTPAETELETTTQRRLAELWSELMPGTVDDPHQDFFELGGDSVLAARLLVEVERRLGMFIAVADFLEHGTTLAGLGTLIDRTPVSGAGVTPTARYATMSVLRLSRSAQFDESAASVEDLERDYRVHPLVLPQLLGQIGPSLTVEEMLEPLLRAIRTAQPEGPYRVIGYSFGGLLTYELGRLLHADGEQVAWLGLLDTPAPAGARQAMRERKSPSVRMARLRETGWSNVIS